MVVAEAGGVGLAVVRAVPVLHGAGEFAHLLAADLVAVAHQKPAPRQALRRQDVGVRFHHRLLTAHDRAMLVARPVA
ncbi:Uncharacterised protein [Mycobacteroides abscessus subsp. abscessus]|nr:Uncharacterised protein [Mycobacteroides abscessus subsp. abscessus]